MRVDKYLQVTRLLKKREFTRELSEGGRLLLNGQAVKPSKKIITGDTVRLLLWNRHITVKVIDIPRGNVSRKDARLYYEIIEEERVDEWF